MLTFYIKGVLDVFKIVIAWKTFELAKTRSTQKLLQAMLTKPLDQFYNMCGFNICKQKGLSLRQFLDAFNHVEKYWLWNFFEWWAKLIKSMCEWSSFQFSWLCRNWLYCRRWYRVWTAKRYCCISMALK